MRLEATEAAATRLRQLTARAPWSITPDALLTPIQQHYDAAAATLESYVGNEDHAEQEWPVSWSQIQNMWQSLVPLTAIAVPPESASEDAAEFRKRAGQLTRRLSEEVDKGRADLAALRADLTSIEAERDAAIAALEEQHAAVQATITEQTKRLEQALRENQVEFTEAEERREAAVKAAISEVRGEFDEALKEERGEFREVIESAQPSVREAIEAAEKLSTDALTRIEEIERKATKSYNAVGNAGFAGMFQRDANSERKQAWLWRIVAVLTFAGLAVAGVLEVNAQGSYSVGEGLARLPVGIGLGSLAVFAISQARRHHDAERASRKREIELTSIDPYLALIEDSEGVEKIKLAHAHRVFIDSVEVAGPPPQDDEQESDA